MALDPREGIVHGWRHLGVEYREPQRVAGLLYKKSPSAFAMGRYQLRHVEVAGGRMTWSKPHPNKTAGEAKGSLDFCINPCVVEPVAGTDTQFTIRPANGQWGKGMFTGAEDSGRIFEFDAEESALDRDTWIARISAHLEFSDTFWKTQVLSLTPGTRIVIVGLKAMLDMNGKLGALTSWDAHENRWRALLDDGRKVLIKPGNMEVIAESAQTADEASTTTGGTNQVPTDSATGTLDAAQEPASSCNGTPIRKNRWTRKTTVSKLDVSTEGSTHDSPADGGAEESQVNSTVKAAAHDMVRQTSPRSPRSVSFAQEAAAD